MTATEMKDDLDQESEDQLKVFVYVFGVLTLRDIVYAQILA